MSCGLDEPTVHRERRVKPTFFAAAAAFRAWLDAHHATAEELWVGYYRKDTGRPSLTWPESVEQALCYGWIDGIRKRVDSHSYTIRFTRRKPRSVWSAANIRMAQQLLDRGEMHPAGTRAFAARRENRSGIYAYRAAQRRPPRLVRPDAQEEPCGVDLPSGATRRVSQDDVLVDRQREEGGDAAQAIGRSDPPFSPGRAITGAEPAEAARLTGCPHFLRKKGTVPIFWQERGQLPFFVKNRGCPLFWGSARPAHEAGQAQRSPR